MERICILAFLGINSWKDIHTREVSLLSIGVFGIVGISPVVIYEDQGFDQMAKDVVSYMEARYPGYNGSFKVYTRRAVGMGDGLLFLSLGTVLPFEELLSAFLLGLFCCCFWGIVVLFLSGKGKKTEMPFVPFLMLGYIGGLIY